MNRNETRHCSECKYNDMPGSREPCVTCVQEWFKSRNGIMWEPKEKDAEGKRCGNCKHRWLDDEPCISCEYRNKWEPETKEDDMKKECANCMHEALDVIDEPCLSCKDYSAWELKEPKEDDMGEKTFTMTFTADKINEETLKTITGETEGEDDLQAKLDMANEKIKDLQDKVDSARLLCAWKNGEIEGLHYAIRHFAKGARRK